MRKIVQRVSLGAAVLMLLPLTVWLTGWHWQPIGDAWWLKGAFLFTETVTAPWGVLTTAVLAVWFLWCLRFRLRAALGLLLILLAAVLIGQAIKSGIKSYAQEHRPYVVWLEQNHNIIGHDFYTHSRHERAEIIHQALIKETQIPDWQRKHWQKETGFSFPSGHTMFACTWALLAVGLLWPGRHYISVILLMLWGTAVSGSRLVLGMHWPVDLAVSIAISWLLVVLFCWLTVHLFGPFSVEKKNVPGDKAMP